MAELLVLNRKSQWILVIRVLTLVWCGKCTVSHLLICTHGENDLRVMWIRSLPLMLSLSRSLSLSVSLFHMQLLPSLEIHAWTEEHVVSIITKYHCFLLFWEMISILWTKFVWHDLFPHLQHFWMQQIFGAGMFDYTYCTLLPVIVLLTCCSLTSIPITQVSLGFREM